MFAGASLDENSGAFCELKANFFRLILTKAEGFGFGMGIMDMCGALSGMMMVIGLENSVGDPEKGKLTKGDTYKKVKAYINKFAEQNGSYLCKELKGVETGKVLRACPDCIRDAVALTEEYLAAQK